jgi:flagellar biosynthesis protein FlhF
VAEALAKVRNDFGDQALIIETRAVREPGLFGRKVGYEIVAASDAKGGKPARREDRSPSSNRFSSEDLSGSRARTQVDVLKRQTLTQVAGEESRSGHLENELAKIRSQIERLATGRNLPIQHLGADVTRALSESDLPDDIVLELDEALGKAGDRLEPARRQDFFARYLARALKCSGALDWDKCRILMMVGPTGVGKTTTIAKLASHLAITCRRKVALVTIDTYRVGATDQLRAYADLLDVPLEIAQAPAQLAVILQRYGEFDNVFIDTAGRSPSDSARVHELRGFCRCSPGINTMLAASATHGRAEFAAVIERFSILPLDHHVITKIDECVAAGRLYGCLRRHQLAANYFTNGQEVPKDIIEANPQLISERALGRPVLAVA